MHGKGKENKEINGFETQFKHNQKAINPFKKGHTPWNKGIKGVCKGFQKKHKEETKEKIRIKLKGRIPWNKGKKMVKEMQSETGQ